MNITDIYDESPNGYFITSKAPKNVDDAIKYYLQTFEEYSLEIYPLEFAIVNYGMACLLYGDKSKPLHSEERAKRVENALYHFNQAAEVFNYKDYPIMFALISIFMSHLFHERASLISVRSFLSKRSTPEESIQFGIDTILEVFPIVSHSQAHELEHACCCVEAGWLYVLQSEYLDNIKNNSIREQAITYLERAISLLQSIKKLTKLHSTVLILDHKKNDHKATRAGQYYTYNPQVYSTYPAHIKLLTSGFTLAYLEGTAYYLLGRLHQGWVIMDVRDHKDDFYSHEDNYQQSGTYGQNGRNNKQPKENTNTEIYNYTQAFEYFSTAVRPKYLTQESISWSDAHHRIASVIIKYPIIIDPEYIPPDYTTSNNIKTNDLYLEVAISHLILALRCPYLSSPEIMDLHFHIAQSFITKLQLIIDAIPYGQSVTKTLIANDSIDLVESIEKHLKEAVKRVTAASTQSTQDGYLYFYSCLKVSEYRMLEAACKPDLTSKERAYYLKDSIEYLIDALMSRPLVDNVDLHYIATAQMSTMLLSCRKTFAACKSYCKTLLCLSVMINRSIFNPETAAQLKLGDELSKQSSQTLYSSCKDIFWVKRHFGALTLNERVTAGYATWSFEDAPNVKTILHSDSSSSLLPVGSPNKPSQQQTNNNTPILGITFLSTSNKNQNTAGVDVMSGSELPDDAESRATYVLNRSSPPKGVPPLKLPKNAASLKKVNVAGTAILPVDETDGEQQAREEDVVVNQTNTMKPKPPPGGVPLSAMGHHPEYQHANRNQLYRSNTNESISAPEVPQEEPHYYSGPYGKRMRRRIPPLKDMVDIDRKVRSQFGFNKSRAVFLIPAYTSGGTGGNSSSAGVSISQLEDGEEASNTDNYKADKKSTNTNKVNSTKNTTNTSNNSSNNNNSNLRTITESGEGDDLGDDDDVNLYEQQQGDDEDASDISNENQSDSEDENYDYAASAAKKGSSKYRPSGTNGSKKNKKSQQEKDTELSKRKKTHIDGRIKQQSVMGWLFRGFVNQTKRTPAPKSMENEEENYNPNAKRKKNTYSFLNPFKHKTVVEQKQDDDTVNLWCSTQCFCSFMLLSRISRMQLILRGRQFHILDSERVNFTLYHMKPKYVETMKYLRENLYKDCSKIIIPPTTLKEIGQRSFLELQILFKSNVKLCKRLDDWEQFLYYKISKVDYFIPMVSVLPVFLRDISAYDNTLLNPNKLIVNLAYEEKIENLIEKNEKFQQKALTNNININSNNSKGGNNSTTGGNSSVGFSYDSVSSQFNSSVGGGSSNNANNGGGFVSALSVEQKKLREEEKEEVLGGKMSLSLSQSLDGSSYLREGQQGIRDMLTTYLALDECLLTWHMPHLPHQNIQCVLTWRDNSASTHAYYSSAEALSHSELYESIAGGVNNNNSRRRKNKKFKPTVTGTGKYKKMGIVMEIAKSDLDTSKLMQLIQNYIDALHSNSAPLCTTMTTDALRALSCALSLTEFLNIIPPHVRSLVINCPPVMRIIPWHLILIELSRGYGISVPGDADVYKPGVDYSKPVEIHLMEKFCVRLGPTLNLYELVETKAKRHRQSTGLHRMCAVDGNSNEDGERPFGIRGSDLEVACVTTTWSADPQDYHVLVNDFASPRNFQTGLFADGNNEQYRKFKKETYISRYESVNPIKMKTKLKREYLEGAPERGRKKKKKDTSDINAEKIFGKMDETTQIKVSGTNTRNKYKPGREEKSDREHHDSQSEEESGSDNSDDDFKEQRKEQEFNMRALSMCRVLHITASKVPLQDIAENKINGDENDSSNSHFEAAIALPKYEKIMTVNNKRVKLKDPRTYVTTSDLIRQIYVKNCALLVLSKFGVTDDISDVYNKQTEMNGAFIESAHLAGANTVLYPLWSSDSVGHGIVTLSHLILLIRFYSILPSQSRDRISAVVTMRKAQLWLRDCTADAVIAFIHKAPIPNKARTLIIDEMEAYVTASLTGTENHKRTDAAAHLTPNKHNHTNSANGTETPDRQPPIAVASPVESGEGTAGNRVGGDKKFFTHFLCWGAHVVSGHGGGVHHPDLMEENKDPDGFDRVDDEELNNLEFEVSVLKMEGKYEDAADLEKYIRQLKLQRMNERMAAIKGAGYRAGRGFLDGLDYLDRVFLDQDSDSIVVSSESSESSAPDSDDLDEIPEEDEDDPDDPLNSRPSRVFKPKPLQLGNLKPENIGYSKWKSKVGSLNLEVKQPVISVQKLVEKKQEAIVRKNREDNYELNMLNKTQGKIDGNGVEVPKVPKKSSKYAKYANKEEERLAVEKKKKKMEKKAAKEAALAAAEEESSDDGSDDSDDDKAELARRKKERQGRFKQSLLEIKSEVRSYQEVTNMLTGAMGRKKDGAPKDDDGCIVC